MTDFQIVMAMKTYGGGFARSLADCWMHGDPDNQRRLKFAFLHEWAKYENLARQHAAQRPMKADDDTDQEATR